MLIKFSENLYYTKQRYMYLEPAIGYTLYLATWLIYAIFVLVGIGLLGYYIYQVALALFW